MRLITQTTAVHPVSASYPYMLLPNGATAVLYFQVAGSGSDVGQTHGVQAWWSFAQPENAIFWRKLVDASAGTTVVALPYAGLQAIRLDVACSGSGAGAPAVAWQVLQGDS